MITTPTPATPLPVEPFVALVNEDERVEVPLSELRGHLAAGWSLDLTVPGYRLSPGYSAAQDILREDRALAYPLIADQLDMLYKAVIASSLAPVFGAWVSAIKAVKSALPTLKRPTNEVLEGILASLSAQRAADLLTVGLPIDTPGDITLYWVIAGGDIAPARVLQGTERTFTGAFAPLEATEVTLYLVCEDWHGARAVTLT